MKLNKHLVLGSKSPRRASLLKEMGFDFRISVTHADENAPLHLNGEQTAVWISEQKAKALQPKLGIHELGITSDTEVWLGNKRYGKASNKEAAVQMIESLSGKTHQVITGLTLSTKEEITSYCSIVQVTFAKMTMKEIHYYVDQFKPLIRRGLRYPGMDRSYHGYLDSRRIQCGCGFPTQHFIKPLRSLRFKQFQ